MESLIWNVVLFITQQLTKENYLSHKSIFLMLKKCLLFENWWRTIKCLYSKSSQCLKGKQTCETNHETGDIQYILADNKITWDIPNENTSNIWKTSSNVRTYIVDVYWHPTMKVCLADQSIAYSRSVFCTGVSLNIHSFMQINQYRAWKILKAWVKHFYTYMIRPVGIFKGYIHTNLKKIYFDGVSSFFAKYFFFFFF